MLGGAPIPSLPKGLFKEGSESAAEFDALAQFLLSIFLPWRESEDGETELDFDFNCNGLIQLLSSWDSIGNSDVIRQRLRHMLNVIVRKSRNKHHELSGQEWRASNSDWWHELEENEKKQIKTSWSQECQKPILRT